MKENNIKFDDEIMRRLMQGTKKEASDNLKHRIMNQAEQEGALKRKAQVRQTWNNNFMKDFYSIMGSMYIVLALLIGTTYITKGKEFLLTSDFLFYTLLIVFVFVFFWMISAIDERLKHKR